MMNLNSCGKSTQCFLYRMELEINRLKFVISQLQMRTSKKGTSGGECSSDKLQCSSSSSASESGSGGSKGLKSKKTHTKVFLLIKGQISYGAMPKHAVL